MHHFLSRIAAAAVAVGLASGIGPATAAPLPTLNSLANHASPVEKAHYYGYRYRGYGYYPYYNYNYWRPWYYRPYYGYRPFYWNYGYRYRPHYYRRYW